MDTGTLLAWLFFMAILLWTAPDAWKEWKAGPKEIKPASWWPLGEASWHGWQRSGPTAELGMLLLVITTGLAAWGGDVAWIKPVGRVFIYLVIFASALAVYVAVFARPRILVPARLRDKPNLIEEWREQR